MVILDLSKWEGSLISSVELEDDETGEEVPSEAIVGIYGLLRSETRSMGRNIPRRYQIVRDGSTYLLFPLDRLDKVRYWPESPGLDINKTLTFHDLYIELQRVNSGTHWGDIPKSIDGAKKGLIASVSRFSDHSYDAVVWNSLDGRFTLRWAGGKNKGVSLIRTELPTPVLGGMRFAYNQ